MQTDLPWKGWHSSQTERHAVGPRISYLSSILMLNLSAMLLQWHGSQFSPLASISISESTPVKPRSSGVFREGSKGRTLEVAITPNASSGTRWALGTRALSYKSTIHNCAVFHFHAFHRIKLEIASTHLEIWELPYYLTSHKTQPFCFSLWDYASLYESKCYFSLVLFSAAKYLMQQQSINLLHFTCIILTLPICVICCESVAKCQSQNKCYFTSFNQLLGL